MEPLNKKTRNILIVVYAITAGIIALMFLNEDRITNLAYLGKIKTINHLSSSSVVCNTTPIIPSPSFTPTFIPTPTLFPPIKYPPNQTTIASSSADLTAGYVKYQNTMPDAGYPIFQTLIPADWTAVPVENNFYKMTFGPAFTTYQQMRGTFYGHQGIQIIKTNDVSSPDVTKWTGKDRRYLPGYQMAEWSDITINGKPAKRSTLPAQDATDTVVMNEGNHIIIFSNRYSDDETFRILLANFVYMDPYVR